MIANRREECVQPDELVELLAGRMPADRFAATLEHVETCRSCSAAAEAAQLADSLSWLRTGEATPSPFDAEPECQAMVGQLLRQPSARAVDAVLIPAPCPLNLWVRIACESGWGQAVWARFTWRNMRGSSAWWP